MASKEVPARRWIAALACMALLSGACSRSETTLEGNSTRHFVVVATGDIACGQAPTPDDPEQKCRYDLVGDLVHSLAPDRFLALGNLQYSLSGPPDYAAYYDRYFGDLMSVTSPTPGDSDWAAPSPQAYLQAFGKAAGAPGGYYSYDIGSWHIISLNSQDCLDESGCGPGTKQYDWLLGDLASHPNSLYPCTLAYFHEPRYLWVTWWALDGLPKGANTKVTPFWGLLYGAGADVILGASAHNYERWAPQNVEGQIDPTNGITEFVVGTGGRRMMPFGPQPRPANLVAAQDTSYGALRLALDPSGLSYAWRSAPEQSAFHDEGRVTCH
jgi:hypothetical protein